MNQNLQPTLSPWQRLAGAARSHGRQVATALAFIAAIAIYGAVVHRHYPIGEWLFWRYLKCWGAATAWLVACTSGGFAIVHRLAPRLPLREALVFGSATGVYLFYAVWFLTGIAQLFRFGPVAYVVPALIGLPGLPLLARELRRAWRHTRNRQVLRRPSLWTVAGLGFGVVCCAAIYYTILSPRNAAFDSVWYHLGLGQEWEALGGIARSPEGWFVESLPNLAAVLYSWAFILPGFDLWDTVELAAHMEYVLFLVTLAQMPLLVRRLIRRPVPAAWAALFLFPAIFVYDASLSTGNDHIAAFWAIPIFLALRRAWRRLEPRYTLLLTVFASGALLTKYQAAALVAAPAVAILGRAVWLGFRRSPAPWGRGLALALGASLLLTAPHWLKNLVWYGDPLYPALHKYIEPRPWNGDIADLVEWNYQRLLKRPKSTGFARVVETVQASFTFSFRSYARRGFHDTLPIFGSLFTLSLLWLPFLRNARRIWPLWACAQVGVMVWYSFSHVERYLQPLVPWMAAVVAASIALAWRQGIVTRAAAGATIAFQLVWGGDTYFFPTHAMLRDSPIRATADLLSRGLRKDYDGRFELGGALAKIGNQLPAGSRVLLHEHNPRLGLRASIVTDMVGYTGLVNYQRIDSSRGMYDFFRELGVTHFVYRPHTSRGFDSIAGDLRFFEFVKRWTEEPTSHGSFHLSRMPDAPPDEELPDLVLYLGCGSYRPGLHRLADMTVRGPDKKKVKALEPLPKDADAIRAMIDRAGYLVYDAKCKSSRGVKTSDFKGFSRAASRKREQLWIRDLP